MDFAVSFDHRVKLKESEKNSKYPNFPRKLKKLRNMKVTFIPMVIGVLGTATKGLRKGLEDSEKRGREETIQNTALSRSARRVRRVLETYCHLNFSERPSANADLKNSQEHINSYGTLTYTRIT